VINPLEKTDELLRRVRCGHPVLGWTLTVLCAPIALAVGLGFLALVLMLGPAIPLVGMVWLVIFAVLSAIGRYNEDYKPDKLLTGASGSVILALGIIITILAIAVIVQLPERWLDRLHFYSPDPY
jgi:hypothetical protein